MVTYVNGNFRCTAGCSGAGILIVDGNTLEMNASMAFYGIVIVRGNVSVLGGGAPPTPCNIYGALITGGGINTGLGGRHLLPVQRLRPAGHVPKRSPALAFFPRGAVRVIMRL